MPLLSYSSALQVMALIALCQPDYTSTTWQAALLTIAFVIFGKILSFGYVSAFFANTWHSDTVQYLRHQQDATH